VCICSGILYHLPQPQRLIAQIAEISPRILINTHCANDVFPKGLIKSSEVELKGRRYRGKTLDEVNTDHPSAGLQPVSFWFFKDDLIALLADLGYTDVQFLKDWMPESPGLTVYAQKSTASEHNV